eukprot:TRINITY_DN1089_c0_g1_i3.p2 TRINITY_DN1089_c0_g1~~TRINITY_DN1089_c0_g1_i3.p2  ORF type:complete len:119 (-),score=2.24 TRINITY_DN1089_c0_g1_i3:136-492(-)
MDLILQPSPIREEKKDLVRLATHGSITVEEDTQINYIVYQSLVLPDLTLEQRVNRIWKFLNEKLVEHEWGVKEFAFYEQFVKQNYYNKQLPILVVFHYGVYRRMCYSLYIERSNAFQV